MQVVTGAMQLMLDLAQGKPQTLHPKLSTSDPPPQTLNLKPSTPKLNLKPSTQNPQP